jgi:hypothetical protein
VAKCAGRSHSTPLGSHVYGGKSIGMSRADLPFAWSCPFAEAPPMAFTRADRLLLAN